MSRPRLVRFADAPATPWRNGGGTTTELLLRPQGATLDHFDWRVSIARIDRDGPFSAFPGCDRWSAILDGDGLLLAVDGRPPATLVPGQAPHAFPGDVPTTGRLVGGPVRNLNLVVRRSRPAPSMTGLAVAGETTLAGPGLLVWAAGTTMIAAAGLPAAPLDPLDSVLFPAESPVTLRGQGSGWWFGWSDAG